MSSPFKPRESHGAPLAQVSAVVPMHATPGETELTIPAGDAGSALCVKVPAEASPGDKLVLTRYDGLGWTCAVAKGAIPDKILSRIPADAVPGSTEVPIVHEGLEICKVKVPANARPGADQLEVTRSADSTSPGWSVALMIDMDHPESVKDMAIAAAQSSLRASPTPADAAYEAVVASVQAAGGYVNPRMTRGRAPPLNIPGMIASEPISAGEELCRIPRELHISPVTSSASAPELWQAVADSGVPESRQVEAGLYSFVARLLQDAEDRAVDQSSNAAHQVEPIPWLVATGPKTQRVWAAHMDQLLGEDFTEHPIRRAAAESQSLGTEMAPSQIGSHLYRDARNAHIMHRVVAGTCAEGLLGAPFGNGMFLRAMLIFQSRQYFSASPRSLIPVADLLNHSPRAHGVDWRWDEGANAHILSTNRAHAAGEELFGSYGNHPNVSLYRCYNFTQPSEEEPVWGFYLTQDLHPALYAQFVPANSSATVSEVYLSSVELSASLGNLLREIAEAGSNPAFFLRSILQACRETYEAEEHLRPWLDALRRTRSRIPSSAAFWEELPGDAYEEGRSSMALTAMRVQMCEYLCLTAHLEAIAVVAGEMAGAECLAGASGMRGALVQHIVDLHAAYHFA